MSMPPPGSAPRGTLVTSLPKGEILVLTEGETVIHHYDPTSLAHLKNFPEWANCYMFYWPGWGDHRSLDRRPHYYNLVKAFVGRTYYNEKGGYIYFEKHDDAILWRLHR